MSACMSDRRMRRKLTSSYCVQSAVMTGVTDRRAFLKDSHGVELNCSSYVRSTTSACSTVAPLQPDVSLHQSASESSNDDFAAVCLDPSHERERGYITGRQMRRSLLQMKRSLNWEDM